MPKIAYIEKSFSRPSRTLIQQANDIISEYHTQGFRLTLRQLYYQFVSRDLIANKQTEYKRLGAIINDARLAGLIDWDAIVDRTRNLQSMPHWKDPEEIVYACANQFRIDKWATQPHRVEVWIEKDALVGVIEGICKRLDVAYFSCRGYTSQSEMWAAGQRILRLQRDHRQKVVLLHFGDHDPSGQDMSRDIFDRLNLFVGEKVEIIRVALNYDQIERYNPPPNPAKTTDSRYGAYRSKFGDESWELDALEPKVLAGLIEYHVELYRDNNLWKAALADERKHKEALSKVAENWEDALRSLTGNTRSA